MATYRAEIKVTSDGSYFPVTVEAGASYTAKETIEHIYNPITIKNLRQVSSSSGSSGDSGLDAGSSIGIIGLIAVGWLFVTFPQYILMLILGAFGTYCGQALSDQTLEEYTQREDDRGHKRAAFVLALALIGGGFGFVQGTNFQKEWNTPDTPTEVKQK
jgi:uncharacterized membrane protein